LLTAIDPLHSTFNTLAAIPCHHNQRTEIFDLVSIVRRWHIAFVLEKHILGTAT